MRKITILIFVFFQFILLQAQNILKIGQYEVLPNSEFSVQLIADNTRPFVAFQVDVSIPEGFRYVDASATLNASRSSGHVLTANLLSGNILRLIGYSVGNTAFLGNSGSLVSFSLKSEAAPATYALVLNQPVLSDSQSNNILTGSINGSVTVIAPNLSLSVSQLDYGRVPIGTTVEQTMQINNTGNSDLVISSIDFSDNQFSTIESTGFTIKASDSRNVLVRFSPTSKGVLAKKMQITGNDPDQPVSSIDLNAVAYAVNEIHVGSITAASSSTGKLEFSLNNMEEFTGFQFDLELPQPMTYLAGTAQLFRSQGQSVSVSQINNNTLRVLAFSTDNKNFTGTNGKVLSLDFSLLGNAGYYSIGIRDVIIANSTGENIVSNSYPGNIIITSPNMSTSSSLDFGEVSILSESSVNFRISNYGQEPLIVNKLQFSSTKFKSNQELPFTIQPYESFDLPLRFADSVEGTTTGTLKIFSNDPDENPFVVQLSGNTFVPNYCLINNQNFIQGDTKIVGIEVENQDPFVALQFDLNYPDGFIPDLNNITLTDRKQDHVFASSVLSETSIRIIIYSPAQKSFTANSGSIINIPFKAENTLLPGTYDLVLSNVLMSNSSSENILRSPKNGVLTIERYNNSPVSSAGPDQSVDENTLVTLAGSASNDPDGDALSYTWTAPEGITLSSASVSNPTFTSPEVEESTSYVFSLTVSDGTLSSSDEVVVTVRQVNNISSLYEEDVCIYPNPVTDELFIEFDGSLDFEIITVLGKVVYRGRLDNNITITTSNLSSGVYLIRFKNQDGFLSKKFIKQ